MARFETVISGCIYTNGEFFFSKMNNSFRITIWVKNSFKTLNHRIIDSILFTVPWVNILSYRRDFMGNWSLKIKTQYPRLPAPHEPDLYTINLWHPNYNFYLQLFLIVIVSCPCSVYLNIYSSVSIYRLSFNKPCNILALSRLIHYWIRN